jgi:hypothetical protein
MSYHTYSSQYSPPSHASSLSSSSAGSHSNYGSGRMFPLSRGAISLLYYCEHDSLVTDSTIAARYEAAKSFDFEDDLEYCPVLTIDEVRQYYDDVTAKSIFYPGSVVHPSPPSQSSTPSPPNNYIRPSPPHSQPARLVVSESQTPVFRPPSRGRGTAAIKIIDPTTREERRRQYY